MERAASVRLAPRLGRPTTQKQRPSILSEYSAQTKAVEAQTALKSAVLCQDVSWRAKAPDWQLRGFGRPDVASNRSFLFAELRDPEKGLSPRPVEAFSVSPEPLAPEVKGGKGCALQTLRLTHTHDSFMLGARAGILGPGNW